MTFRQEQREPHHRVVAGLVERLGGVPVSEVPRPTAQEQIHILHDLLDRRSQPGPHRHEPDAVPGMLHRLARWPTGQEGELAGPMHRPGMHQPMVEAEEVQSLATVGQVHDPGLGLFRLQAEIGEQTGQPRQRGDRLPLGPAEHHQIIGLCRVPDYAASECVRAGGGVGEVFGVGIIPALPAR